MEKLYDIDLTKGKDVSEKLYGLFLEDINYSVDGGLNNNMISNYNFGYQEKVAVKNWDYFLRKIHKKFRKKIEYEEIAEPLKYWTYRGDGNVKTDVAGALKEDKPYLTAYVNGVFRVENIGYNGGKADAKSGRYVRNHSGVDAVTVVSGQNYDVSFYVKNVSFDGEIRVFVEGDGVLTEKATVKPNISKDFVNYSAKVGGIKDGVGKFILEFVGKGEIALDYVYFGNCDYYGAGDPKWSGGRFRKDLVEAIKEIKPAFMRFPGGCIVEGYNLKNGYFWKETVGKLTSRGGKPNLWGESQVGGDYFQTFQIGFYEYFCLCEELGCEPVPIINAGLACQGRTTAAVKSTDAEFKRYIEDALDLIEFANGDPNTSVWARLRAESGHKEPFNLKIIGIGNENWGDLYIANFIAIKKAVKAKYPEIDTIFCVGFDGYGNKHYEERRARFDKTEGDSLVDDHFYRTPSWAIENCKLYDDYDRKRAKIFVGEFAANTPFDNTAMPNNYYSALGEAAFYTGLERNADIVKMYSYAPLLSKVGGEQWKHNLINFNGTDTLRTANYYVLKLFANNYGNKYIPLSNCCSDGVFASVTRDDKSVFIKLINTNRNPVGAELNFDGAAVSHSARVSVIQSDNDYERNALPYIGQKKETVFPKETVSPINNGKLSLSLKSRSVNVIKIDL